MTIIASVDFFFFYKSGIFMPTTCTDYSCNVFEMFEKFFAIDFKLNLIFRYLFHVYCV